MGGDGECIVMYENVQVYVALSSSGITHGP